ncbi:MAG: hypothetical protein V1647_05865 [Pseudomonadota bacterium]
MIIILSLILSMLDAQVVTPYGAKVLALSEGGRPFVTGYDAVMTNPAGAAFVDSTQFGFGMNFGNYKSLSAAYIGESGFHIVQAIHDLDSNNSVAMMQTYFGFAYEFSKWWVIGFNVGYNYLKTSPGWDINFGIDFGPGIRTANHSGFIGSISIRNPIENAGVGEFVGSLGYTYRSAFSISVDNMYRFSNDIVVNNVLVDISEYDIVAAVETFPLESDEFSMLFSVRINAVSEDNDMKAGMGFGYLGEDFRFDLGLYANDFRRGGIQNITFGFSFIYGV